MEGNLLIVHGGGPTAVINASLYGVITEAKKNPAVKKIYGAIGGTEAVLKERFLDLSEIPEEKLPLLLQTPGTAIGSSRFPLEEEDYLNMVEIFRKNDIKFVLQNGGNGSMDTCGKIYKACAEHGINVVGIPKTMDNDLSIIDHAPGYGSAARYIAAVTREIGADVKSLPIHVCVIEAMGRNAGWITAASALARKDKSDAPHLIYLPERPFNETEFLEDVKELYDKLGGVVVVVSEGLKDEKGESVVPPVFRTERAVYYGDVSAHLAGLVTKKLGIKARNEKPGLCGRTSMVYQSQLDMEEAILVGEKAVQAVTAGETGVMVGIIRMPGEKYKIETPLIPIEEVMMYEKMLPENYMNDRGNNVTDSFIEWCRPLIGDELPEYISFIDLYNEKMSNQGTNSRKAGIQMKHIYLNLKRFDIPRELGGVNSIAPLKDWGSYIVKNTKEELKKYAGEAEFAMYFPEAHVIGAAGALEAGDSLEVGCQGLHYDDTAVGGGFGAFTTGRTGNAMVAAGCKSVIIGHCEERKDKLFIMKEAGAGDSEAVSRILNKEIKATIRAGLSVLYCIGESAEEQDSFESVLRTQLTVGLDGVDKSKVAIAYEPIWAIGPGKTPPDREYIEKIAKFIKKETDGMVVTYGGGLKVDNAKMLASIPEIDGGLIALTRFQGEIGFYPEEYLEIIKTYMGK